MQLTIAVPGTAEGRAAVVISLLRARVFIVFGRYPAVGPYAAEAGSYRSPGPHHFVPRTYRLRSAECGSL